MNFDLKRILFILVVVAFTLQIFAADTTAQDRGIAYYYNSGGPVMHIITALLVIVIILAIVKFIKLSIKEKLDAERFYIKLKGYIKNEQYKEAIKISKTFKKTTLGYIFWNGLLGFYDSVKHNKPASEQKQILQNSFDEAAMQKIPEIDANIYWFDIIAQVSTLLGLLGTIFGLITAFTGLGDVPESEKNEYLTRGISQAMATTAYGLIVAIPTMFVRGLLQGRAERIINDIDEYSVKAINQISYKIKD